MTTVTGKTTEKNNFGTVKKINWAFTIVIILLLGSCKSDVVYDQNLFLPAEGWHYKNKAAFDITIDDTTHYHNFFINLRINSDYEYSNLYVLMYGKSPAGDSTVRRIDLTLAAPDGKWLGKGTASVISYRIPIIQKYAPKPGTYHFEIEQNMRVNTLPNVINVGIAVEKGDEIF